MPRATKAVPAVIRAEYLTSAKEITAKVENASWLELSMPNSKGTIEIGRNNGHHDSNSAISFWVDAVKFGKYDHLGTDWDNECHVYASIGDVPYAERGATIKVGDAWYIADFRAPNGKVKLLPVGEPFDVVDHTAEIISELQHNGADLNKQLDAKEAERSRVTHARNHTNKHNWGVFFGYNFRVWIAHERDLAEHYYKVVNNPDIAKAAALRDTRIDKRITYDTHVGPVLRRVKAEIAQTSRKTDEPDGVEGVEPKEKSEGAPTITISSIVMPFADKGIATSTKIDMFKLPAGTNATVWHQDRGGLHDIGFWRLWDPESPDIVKSFRIYSEHKTYFVEVEPEFLAVAEVK